MSVFCPFMTLTEDMYIAHSRMSGEYVTAYYGNNRFAGRISRHRMPDARIFPKKLRVFAEKNARLEVELEKEGEVIDAAFGDWAEINTDCE